MKFVALKLLWEARVKRPQGIDKIVQSIISQIPILCISGYFISFKKILLSHLSVVLQQWQYQGNNIYSRPLQLLHTTKSHRPSRPSYRIGCSQNFRRLTVPRINSNSFLASAIIKRGRNKCASSSPRIFCLICLFFRLCAVTRKPRLFFRFYNTRPLQLPVCLKRNTSPSPLFQKKM